MPGSCKCFGLETTWDLVSSSTVPFCGVEGCSSGEEGMGLRDLLAKFGNISRSLLLCLFNDTFSRSVLMFSNFTVGVGVASDGSGCSGAVVREEFVDSDIAVSIVAVDNIETGGVSGEKFCSFSEFH